MPDREPHVIRVSSMNVRNKNRAAPPLSVASRRTPVTSAPSRTRERMSGGIRLAERLLRDCALCTAAVLCVLAVGNINQPWARSVSSTVRSAVTMDLDESLGRLQFVRNILPESALVFWNVGQELPKYQQPATGRVVHTWKQSEPWLQYACEAQSVVAADAGEVMAITQSDDQAYMVRIRHADGMETLYGDLAACIVREGEGLQAGQVIGTVDSSLFFEVRRDGKSLNPSGYLRGR